MVNKSYIGITGKMTVMSIALVLFSVTSIVIVGYFVNYAQIDRAAGEELIGCANIATGMIDTDMLEALTAGDSSVYAALHDKVNYPVDHKPIFLNASIIAFDGTVLVPDRRLLEQGFRHGDAFHIDGQAVAELRQTGHPTYSDIYTYGGIERKTGYAPIFRNHDPNEPMIALMAVDFEESVIAGRTLEMLAVTLQLGGAFPLVAGAVAYWFARRLSRPILAVASHMNMLANGDLTLPRLQQRGGDEIGVLASSFNRMYEHLQHDIRTIARHAHELTDSSASISGMAEQLTEVSRTQTELLTTASGMVHELSRAVQSVARNIEQAADYFEKTVETGSAGTLVIQATQEAMRHINVTMDELSGQSNRIGEVLAVIDKISDQTHLLSLNAAIEAAHAGEAGKGFAIVAGEVRKLAEHSGQATGEIARLVELIRTNTQAAVEAVSRGNEQTAEAGHAFGRIVEAMQQAAVAVADIAAACEQQAAQSEEVLRSVSSTSDAAQQAAKVVRQSAERAAELEHIAASLERISGKFKTEQLT